MIGLAFTIAGLIILVPIAFAILSFFSILSVMSLALVFPTIRHLYKNFYIRAYSLFFLGIYILYLLHIR